MASTIINLPADTWVQITDTDTDGSIFQHTEKAPPYTPVQVVYTESASMPSSDESPSPISGYTVSGGSLNYHSLADGESLYAKSIGRSSVITKTPVI